MPGLSLGLDAGMAHFPGWGATCQDCSKPRYNILRLLRRPVDIMIHFETRAEFSLQYVSDSRTPALQVFKTYILTRATDVGAAGCDSDSAAYSIRAGGKTVLVS